MKIISIHTNRFTSKYMHEDCAICLESLDSKRTVETVETLCGHVFHKECLSQVHVHEQEGVVYIQCPLCREHIPPVIEPSNDDHTNNFFYVSMGILLSGFIGATSFWLLLRYAPLS